MTNRTYSIPFNETRRGSQVVMELSSDQVRQRNDGIWVVEDGEESPYVLDENLKGEDWVPKPEDEAVWYVNEEAKGEQPGVVQAPQDKSILVLGETGSGKTEAIKLLTYQFSVERDEPLVVFDYKNDYREFFENIGRTGDMLTLSLDGSDEIWNIFNEVTFEAEFEEIGRILFGRDEEESQNPFFPQAARQVFIAICKYLYRRGRDDTEDLRLSNQELVDQLERHDMEYWYKLLTNGSDEASFDRDWVAGLSGAVSTINPEASRQAVSVFSHLQTTVGEIFKGDFAAEGDFAIREYMQNPDGRVLVLDYPLDRGETVKPIYRFYIDWAIRYALQDRSTDAYFVLDEFQTIPGLEKIERLVNAGRARNAYSILGLQSVAQLQMTYGEEHARSILSGLAQEILLRSGDKRTTDYTRNRLAQHFVTRTVDDASLPTRDERGRIVDDPSNRSEITREEYPVSEKEVQQLAPGECFLVLPEEYFRGRLMMLEWVLQLGRLSGIIDRLDPN